MSLDRAPPCLVLIDEWIAYVRQLYGVSGLPAGSFDANLTFAQSLTEAAKAVRYSCRISWIIPKCRIRLDRDPFSRVSAAAGGSSTHYDHA
jgi:hypothetical protein